uniref:Uncharacterized protein n=1 Tax=Setaria viridis TaxID=4556 RepID=A0A4U6W424_SETVI|nr:hypothetical protein SEVIR_1G028700v2 [Setaria viridis]
MIFFAPMWKTCVVSHRSPTVDAGRDRISFRSWCRLANNGCLALFLVHCSKGDERASGRPCTPIMHTSFRHTTTTTLLQPSPLSSSSGLRFYAWFLDRWPRNASAFPGAFTAGPAARVAHESVIR